MYRSNISPKSLLLSRLIESLRKADWLACTTFSHVLSDHYGLDLTESDYDLIRRSGQLYSDRYQLSCRSKLYSKWCHGWTQLSEKLQVNKPISVLFINDNGFRAGAGIGLRRQVESFLYSGNEVTVFCASENGGEMPVGTETYLGRFNGIRSFSKLLPKEGQFMSWNSRSSLIEQVKECQPDLVITGNFHAKQLDPLLIADIQRIGIPVVVYAHDCDWATGGCAHFKYYNCSNYLSGCTIDNCPKPEGSYPHVDKGLLATNWAQRTVMFDGDMPVPIATNSDWLSRVLEQRFSKTALIGKVRLSVDTSRYRYEPHAKAAAKKQLGIEPDCVLILAGSSTVGSRGKGGGYIRWLAERVISDRYVRLAIFGNMQSNEFPANVISLGYISSESKLSNIYSATDIFLNPVEVESFGQTMMEAAASGAAIVSFNSAGEGEISADGINALHSCFGDRESLLSRVRELIGNACQREWLGRNGRWIVEDRFSHAVQAWGWRKFLVSAARKIRRDLGFAKPGIKHRAGYEYSGEHETVKKSVTYQGGPRISIITVTFDCGDEFKDTAESIVEQEYPHIEWIVVDGKSEAHTMSLIEGYRSQIDAFVSERDRGIYDAMNKGADLATGEYVLFLGAGDMLAGSKAISRCVSHFRRDIDVLFGNVLEVRPDGRVVESKVIPFEQKWDQVVRGSFEAPLMKGLPPHQSTFMRADLIRDLRFDLSFSVSADWELLFRCYSKGGVFRSIPCVVAWYPNGGYSFVNSVQWLRDVKRIMAEYTSNEDQVKSYFDELIDRQEEIVKLRVNRLKVLTAYDEWIENGYIGKCLL